MTDQIKNTIIGAVVGAVLTWGIPELWNTVTSKDDLTVLKNLDEAFKHPDTRRQSLTYLYQLKDSDTIKMQRKKYNSILIDGIIKQPKHLNKKYVFDSNDPFYSELVINFNEVYKLDRKYAIENLEWLINKGYRFFDKYTSKREYNKLLRFIIEENPDFADQLSHPSKKALGLMPVKWNRSNSTT